MKKSLFVAILCVVCCVACILCFAACGEHEHTYSEEWSSDENYHWHSATCRHKEETADKAEHDWDDGEEISQPTCTEPGEIVYRCTVCGAVKTEVLEATGHTYSDEWTFDENYHWRTAVCEHTGEIADKSVHEYEELSCAVCGYTIAGTQGLKYTLSESGDSYLVSGIGTVKDADIVIPSLYNGLPVTGIGKKAFSSNNFIESVIIPDSVTDIADYAFYFCESLKNLDIPDGVTSIGENAFQGCTSLKSIVIPEGVTSIGWRTFESCTSLEKVVLPESLTEIRYEAFRDCSSLYSVTIPENVTSIFMSFYGCDRLVEVYNYSQLNIEKGSSDNGYVALNAINVYTVPQESRIIKSGDYVFYDGENGAYLLNYLGREEKITLPANYNGKSYKIHKNAFNDNGYIKEVTIPGGVTDIGPSAFANCEKLMTVNISYGVKSIGNSSFYSSKMLSSVSIPKSIESIGRTAFAYCDSLKSVNLPDNLKSLESGIFMDCKSLTEITIPNSVESIGESAFCNCDSLKSVNLPDNLKSLERGIFMYCDSLTEITIPSGVTSIGSSAFYGCDGLKNVTLPAGLTSIGSGAFGSCKSLSLNKYDNAYYLGKTDNPYFILIRAVDSSVQSCDIHEDTEYIHYEAFEYCDRLTEITIPDGVILEIIESYSFTNCISLESIVIPENVKYISSSAFENCESLKSVNIPEGLEFIDRAAFSGCIALSEVTLPDSLEHLGDSSFAYCISLESISLPENIISISLCAFQDCVSLKSINIPEGVKTIESFAFYNCRSGNYRKLFVHQLHFA